MHYEDCLEKKVGSNDVLSRRVRVRLYLIQGSYGKLYISWRSIPSTVVPMR